MLPHTPMVRNRSARGALGLVLAVAVGIVGAIVPVATPASADEAPGVAVQAQEAGTDSNGAGVISEPAGDDAGANTDTDADADADADAGAGDSAQQDPNSDQNSEPGLNSNLQSSLEPAPETQADAAPAPGSPAAPIGSAPEPLGSMALGGPFVIMSEPPAPPAPPASSGSTRTISMWMPTTMTVDIKKGIRDYNSSLVNIYENGVKVDSVATGYGQANFQWITSTVSLPSLTLHNMRDLDPGFSGQYTHMLECISPDIPQDGFTKAECSLPENFSATIEWEISGKLQSCVNTAVDPREDCETSTWAMTEVYEFWHTRPAEHDPVAGFTTTQSTSDPHEFTLTNTSSDVDTGFASLSSAWDFGDGETSTGASPTHRYANSGSYSVTLVVTDPTARTSSVTHSVEVFSSLVVNSQGDDPATDPAVLGCNTGGTVGADNAPECTLRAAIETANALGGGEISFEISGTPLIVLGSPLPVVTGTTVIDGTTQSGGWAEVSGGGEATLTLGDGTSTVSGLALHGASRAIDVSAGSGHVIEGNRLGVNRSGTPVNDTRVGVILNAGTVSAVRDNVIAASSIGIFNASETSIGEITGNSIGVSAAGTVLGDVGFGVLLVGSGPSQIERNLIRATQFGIMVAGPQTAGTTITANRVGTTGTTAFSGVGTGIVVEGAADVTVQNNTVAAGDWGGILVAGSPQVTFEGDEITFLSPTGVVLDKPASSTGVQITGNTISAPDAGTRGIGSWADATALTIADNTITAAGAAGGIALTGGADHAVTDNVLGTSGSPLSNYGVWLVDTDGPTVSGNTVFTARHGVYIDGDGAGATISKNTVTAASDGPWVGIRVDDERSGVTVEENIVAGAGRAGIELDAPGVQITGNTVTGAGNGIVADGESMQIRDNYVGIAQGSTVVVGNLAIGILLATGSATMRGNVVAGSGGDGIRVGTDAKATLRGNRVWNSGGTPIATPDSAPNLSAALISDTGSTWRTTLLVTGVPTSGAGTIEVFANDTCGAGGAEAKYVLGVTRDTVTGRDSRIIQFESTRDNFTLTYTDKTGATSSLSSCESRKVYPDGDSDGSPDPIDALIGADNNPALAALVTTKEQVLVISTDLGSLENVRIMDDPSAAHPAGWNLPYGAIGFSISGLEPGGTTQVSLSMLYVDEVLQGSSYWKYGPATSGAAPSWYDFAMDAITGTGAQKTAVSMGSIGFRTAFVLTLIDGARGDSDGMANGTIVDPGGPVIGGTPGPGPGGGPGTTPGSGGAGAGALAATGADAGSSTFGMLVGLMVLLIGAGLLRAGRARKSAANQARAQFGVNLRSDQEFSLSHYSK